MPNPKVKELVERVRLTPEEIEGLDFTYDFKGQFTSRDVDRHYRRIIAKAQLNKVLNDPDLALIDRSEDFVTCPRCGGTVWRPYPSPNGSYYVIPLAEALKEKNGSKADNDTI